MEFFLDKNGNKVELTFTQRAFQEEAKHVLVICQYGEDWLLTKHKQRGLEFPGGKMESGETLEQTARREAYEETGAFLGELTFIAEYKFTTPAGSFVKAVYWGKVNRVEETANYHETNGPVVITGDILRLRFEEHYSFIMKDKVVEECIKHIHRVQNKNE
jgi:8-oxo-dGTP diphosphatase